MVKGPAVWLVDGREVRVRATYFLVIEGRLQFTVDYVCQDECADALALGSESAALSIAAPVMRYVVAQGLYRDGEVRDVTGKRLDVELVGVALTEQLPGGKERGYRVARTIRELQGAVP